MRAVYPSDITREQFLVIEYDLKSARKATRPRTYDLYNIFVRSCMFSKRVVRGAVCHTISPSGTSFTTITKYGAQQEKTAKLRCLTVFYRNRSYPSV
jgi:hypothetical protein